MKLDYDTFDSPIGTILVAAREGRLCSLDFAGFEIRFEHLLGLRYPGFHLERRADPAGVASRLSRYFQRDFAAFNGLDADAGGTPFQQAVWGRLREIPAGETWTYGQLAREAGNESGSRAAGRANSLNPIAIALPCHRVVGANGALTGYAGGLERKRWLLEHEGALFRANGKVPNLQAVLPFDRR